MFLILPVIDALAAATSKVSVPEEYLAHVNVRLQTLPSMKKLAELKAPKRWKFHCYRKEQLAVKKLSEDLRDGCRGKVVVVWGNGGFPPTSKGHPAAPNKRLRRMLSKYLPVMVSSEYRSSQRSACCHDKLIKHDGGRGGTLRSTVSRCKSCRRFLSRDLSAAGVILDIFEHQRATQSASSLFVSS